jgi:hypothetical protein
MHAHTLGDRYAAGAEVQPDALIQQELQANAGTGILTLRVY